MTFRVTATYENGVLIPDQALPLAEGTRVKLTIETLESPSPEKLRAASENLQGMVADEPFHLGGDKSPHDELIDRE